MPTSIGEVRHDATTLCRFIDSISADCRLGDFPFYAPASRAFFDYVYQLAEATKVFLQQFTDTLDPGLANSDPEQFLSRAQVLRTIRLSWFELHQFVKPALEADTLHTPYALVGALANRVQQIDGFDKVQFAVFHTSQLNYFQIGASSFRTFADGIAAIVPNAPTFRTTLGIILLPYSQSSSVFLNLALAHEMGHYSFQERKEAAGISGAVISAVQEAAKGSKLEPLDLVWCKDRLLDWCEELYCDCFALWLVGPCFSLAFVDLFGYTRLAPTRGPDGSLNPAIATEAAFSDSHPAAAFRLREHVTFLQDSDLSWWQMVAQEPNHYLDLLLEAERLPVTAFSYKSRQRPHCANVALTAFWKVSGEVRATVKKALASVPVDADSFDRQRSDIEEYLSYGVVPSRLITKRGPETPSVVALLNAASIFYLKHLDHLINRVKRAEPNCLYCRSQWGERVEMWTSKALEDLIRV